MLQAKQRASKQRDTGIVRRFVCSASCLCSPTVDIASTWLCLWMKDIVVQHVGE
jgi:hypothetical protein